MKTSSVQRRLGTSFNSGALLPGATKEFMREFPFTKADWNRVSEAARAIVNATLIDDDVLADCRFSDLRETLDDLREKYGEHPILLETEADFRHDPNEAISLYSQALAMARENGLPTETICLSYARALIENRRDLDQARELLKACHDTIHAGGDEADIRDHDDLTAVLGDAGE